MDFSFIGKTARKRTRELIRAGNAARDRSDWAEAAAFYRQVIEVAPENAAIRVQLGHACKEMGDFRAANEHYQKALELTPLDDDLHLQIGHLRKLAGDLQGARSHYVRSLALNPENSDARAEEAALQHVPLPVPAPVASSMTKSFAASAAPAQVDLHPGTQTQDPWIYRTAGDAARDSRLWDEAKRAYRDYLRLAPEDVAIWVQYGHALKESGDLRGAEEAYLTGIARAPDDADLQLQLGHVLKLLGRVAPAIEAYQRSFALCPSMAALRELEALDAAHEVALPAGASAREPILFLELSDLFAALLDQKTVSGIQRVQLEIIAFAFRNAKPDLPRPQFVIWHRDLLWMLGSEPLRALLAHYEITAGSEFERRRALIHDVRASAQLLRPVPGDIVMSTGAIYRRPNVASGHEALKRAGVRIGAYIHDFIPLTHPEYCARILTNEFSSAITDALLHLDFVLTVSEHVASETKRLLRDAGFAPIPVAAVPEGHGFTQPDGSDVWTSRILGLRDTEFVLCVGTISAHKNQALLVRIWQLLQREGRKMPYLVLVGRRGDGVRDLFEQLEVTHFLDDHVRIIEGLTDGELRTLYRASLFTMFPSIVEGWGLPIGESLAQGKVCITSNTASMPEVAGDFALYIDPFNLRAASKAVAKLLDDRSELTRLENRIRSSFRLRTWEAHGEALVRAAWRLGGAETTPATQPRPFFMQAGRLNRTVAVAPDWGFGNRLPDWRAAVEMVLRRVVLTRGWYASETWGTWMRGAHGTISFRTEVKAGERIRVAFILRAAVWARGNQLEITSACGATSVVAVPETRSGPPFEWPNFIGHIDCVTGSDGVVTLDMRVLGKIPTSWWGEKRVLCIGLSGLVYMPLGKIGALPINRVVSAGCLTLPNGNPLAPNGAASLMLEARRRGLFAGGWRESAPWGTWMAGRHARLVVPVEAPAGTTLRLVLNLRVASSCQVQVDLRSACGAQIETTLSDGDTSDQRVWLDCKAGPSGELVVDISAVVRQSCIEQRRGPVIGLRSLAYGRAGSRAERDALAEALQFPRSVGANKEAEEAVASDMRFTVAGHINGSYSLSAVNRSLAFALEAVAPGSVRVLQVEGKPVTNLSELEAAERGAITPLVRRRLHDSGLEIVISQHHPVWVPVDPSELAISWFPWEESLVPLEIVRVLNKKFDAVVVQTHFIKKVLIDSGVSAPIRLMGCAVSLKDFIAIGFRRAGQLPRTDVSNAAPFTFLHVSSCFPRKGVDVLLAAYARAFRRGDPVRLVIKGFPNPHNDVAEQIAQLIARDPQAPEIEFINADCAWTEVLRLYEQADAVVLPTRGEGFNIPAAEALAAGIPLIVTGHSGQRDFAGPDVARQVAFDYARSGSHLKTGASVWAEPSVDDLATAMREAIAGGSEAAARIARGQRIADALNDTGAWARRVRQIAMNLIGSGQPKPPVVAWVSTWGVKCGIATHSDYLLASYPDAERFVTVLCDERTPMESLERRHGPKAKHAWRVADSASIDRLADAIDNLAALVVVIQHQPGLIAWRDLAGLLMDGRLEGRKSIVALHNVQELMTHRDRMITLNALQRASRILVHCIRDLNTLKSFGLIENVTLLPPGAIPPHGERPTVRHLTRDSEVVIGCYGFFLPQKRIDVVIEAVARMRKNWPNISARLVCAEFPADVSREEIRRCRELAERLGIAAQVEWHNEFLPDDESLALLRVCDLVVMPYQETQEAASGAMRVAMASRVPILTSPIAMFEEAGPAVLRAESNEVAAVERAIEGALDDQRLRKHTVEKAEEWLTEHDWARMMERTRGIMLGLLASDDGFDPPGWPP